MQDHFCEYTPKIVLNTVFFFIAIILIIKLYFSTCNGIPWGFARSYSMIANA